MPLQHTQRSQNKTVTKLLPRCAGATLNTAVSAIGMGDMPVGVQKHKCRNARRSRKDIDRKVRPITDAAVCHIRLHTANADQVERHAVSAKYANGNSASSRMPHKGSRSSCTWVHLTLSTLQLLPVSCALVPRVHWTASLTVHDAMAPRSACITVSAAGEHI